LHKRAEIKKIVYDILYNKTEAGDRLFLNRFFPLQREKDFPLISIYSVSESLNEARAQTNDVTAKIAIAIFTKITRTTEDLSDKIAADVMSEISKYKSNEFLFTYNNTEIDVDGSNLTTDLCTLISYDVQYIQEANFNGAEDLSEISGCINCGDASILFNSGESV